MSIWEAVAEPTRRAIMLRLAEADLTAGEIADGFEISRPGVSRHLRVLRESGLVNVRRDGTRQIYSLDGEAVGEIEQWAVDVRRFWGQRLDALDTEIRRGKTRAKTAGGTAR